MNKPILLTDAVSIRTTLTTADVDPEFPCSCGHVVQAGETAVLVAGRDEFFCVGHEPLIL